MGLLFKNDRKKEDKHPDYTGFMSVRCSKCQHEQEYNMAAWTKTNDRGSFLALADMPSVREKQARAAPASGYDPAQKKTSPPPEGDNLPF